MTFQVREVIKKHLKNRKAEIRTLMDQLQLEDDQLTDELAKIDAKAWVDKYFKF